MATLLLTTSIRAPARVCFDLARSVDAHVVSAAGTGERAIAGVTSGLLALGDEVTWEARHFGFTQRLRVRITAFDPPTRFVDEMIHGAFAWMRHEHTFAEQDGVTTMVDQFAYAAPLGPLGWVADTLVVRRHMLAFLRTRNIALKTLAEATATGGTAVTAL